MRTSRIQRIGLSLAAALLVSCVTPSRTVAQDQPSDDPFSLANFVAQYCADCHTAGQSDTLLAFRGLDEDIPAQVATWEKIVRRLRTRQMPPSQVYRPTEDMYVDAVRHLERLLDHAAAQSLNPGRTDALRRMTRFEYGNVVRDLVGIQVDVENLLPADSSSHGFDNITVSDLAPALMNRYLSAAQQISRTALGRASAAPDGVTFRVRPDVTQEEHVAGLPLGTRGGAAFHHFFATDGEYEFQIRLARDRNEQVEGLRSKHELVLLVDRQEMARFTVEPPADGDHSRVDAHLVARLHIDRGPHVVAATFVKQPSTLLETRREPFAAHFNMHRHPRLSPALFQLSIVGPFSGENEQRQTLPIDVGGVLGRVLTDDTAESSIRASIAKFLRQAYRRPVTDGDIAKPYAFFREGLAEGGIRRGWELALSVILVSPDFLFRIERDPPNTRPGTAYPLNDFELASRLSFFLWSSCPDDELLSLAEQGGLHEIDTYRHQVRRMLADARSKSLAINFAGQWLHLRNLQSFTPDLRMFPDFDDNLRQAMRQETELFFDAIVRDDGSLLELVDAQHTYLNERLAKHYGVPHIHGSHFRRVALDSDSHRGGVLRHGSVLTVTSYATRTSPVLRGNWVLTNLVGTPAPPPPPNVPALDDNVVAASLPVRERLAQHRADAACASCHDRIDPVGFALENYDAVGRWRKTEEGRPVDASGELGDGVALVGVEGLEQGLLQRPEVFVTTFVEKLLTYALGRGLDYNDAAAVRQIVRDAQRDNYRLSAIVTGVATSLPFQMRRAE